MDNQEVIIQTTSHRLSRRGLLLTGAATGLATAMGLPLLGSKADAAPQKFQNRNNDIKVLNNGLYYEYQAI